MPSSVSHRDRCHPHSKPRRPAASSSSSERDTLSGTVRAYTRRTAGYIRKMLWIVSGVNRYLHSPQSPQSIQRHTPRDGQCHTAVIAALARTDSRCTRSRCSVARLRASRSRCPSCAALARCLRARLPPAHPVIHHSHNNHRCGGGRRIVMCSRQPMVCVRLEVHEALAREASTYSSSVPELLFVEDRCATNEPLQTKHTNTNTRVPTYRSVSISSNVCVARDVSSSSWVVVQSAGPRGSGCTRADALVSCSVERPRP